MKKDSINIVFIVVLTLIVAGLCLKFLPSFPVTSDTEEYDTVALNLVQGKGLTLDNEPTKEPLGYPLFLAGIYSLFGHNWQAVQIIQFILLAGMGMIFYLTTRKFFNFSLILALLSSLTFVLWPYFIFYPNLITTEILFIFFLLLSIYFLLSFLKEPSLKNSLILGVLLGIAALVRPVALLLPFWLVLFLLIFLKSARTKTYFFKLAVFLVVFTTVFSPWVIRNYIHYHELFPVYSHVIEKSYIDPDHVPTSQFLESEKLDLKTLALSRLRNIYLFWNPGADGLNAEVLREKFPIIDFLLHAYRVLFFMVLALAFWSLKAIRQKKKILFLWIIIFYFWALHTMLFPYPRYTMPVIPIIIILAWFSLRNIAYKIGEKT